MPKTTFTQISIYGLDTDWFSVAVAIVLSLNNIAWLPENGDSDGGQHKHHSIMSTQSGVLFSRSTIVPSAANVPRTGIAKDTQKGAILT